MTWMYVIAISGQPEPIVKIGITGNVSARLSELSTASPFRLEVLARLGFQSRYEAIRNEQAIHRELRSFRLQGEWFHLDPWTLDSLLHAVRECAEVVH